MKSVFKEISFRSNEDMTKESAKVFTKLTYIEHFHLETSLGDVWNDVSHGIGITITTQPFGHEGGAYHDFVCPY